MPFYARRRGLGYGARINHHDRYGDLCLYPLQRNGDSSAEGSRGPASSAEDGAFYANIESVPAPAVGVARKEPVKTMAVVAKWGKRRVTIDGSAALVNGLFLKFEREFEGTSTYEDIVRQVRKDEEELFSILGVEEDRA
jgi:hypothetical protein